MKRRRTTPRRDAITFASTRCLIFEIVLCTGFRYTRALRFKTTIAYKDKQSQTNNKANLYNK